MRTLQERCLRSHLSRAHGASETELGIMEPAAVFVSFTAFYVRVVDFGFLWGSL